MMESTIINEGMKMTKEAKDNPAAGKFGMFISPKKGKRFTPLGPLKYHKFNIKLKT